MTFKNATPEERKAYLQDYHALIRKIRTSIEVAENAEMEAIDISGE